MQFIVEVDLEEDGRWIADVPELPGVMAYGATKEEALSRVQALAFTVIADEIEHGERDARAFLTVSFISPKLHEVMDMLKRKR